MGGLLVSAVLMAQDRGRAPAETARREDAYRQNNVGVARLEQYDYSGAATAFRRALTLQPELGMARLNLALALLYDRQLEAAVREARLAAETLPAGPQPAFVEGLIARADNRPEAASTAFEKVMALDPADVGSRVQLGQLRLTERRFADAAALFDRALALEPFNATAAYGLAVALTRAGDRQRGERAMQRFQQLRDNPAAITYSTAYLEQGRYAEAIASTGLEPELVDRAVPPVTFVDVTASMLPGGEVAAAGVTLADVDRDGRVDLLLAQRDGVHVFRNAGGTFTAGPVARADAAIASVAGDYDNDGTVDLLVITGKGLALEHGGRDGAFRDVSAEALPPTKGPVRTAALVDADHDGDLDIVAGASLLRNSGAGRFEDVTGAAQLTVAATPTAIVPTDYDNRRDVDLLFVATDAAPRLFSNQRDGTFRDVAIAVGLSSGGRYTSVAAADVNKDLAPDFFFGRADAPGVFALSERGNRFTLADAPPATKGTTAAQLVDYDNDGLLDLFAVTSSGPRLWRGTGGEWIDVTGTTLPAALAVRGDAPVTLTMADLDDDGDEDAVVRRASGAVRVWRNDGGNARPSLRVRLAARVSNRDAAGAKIDLRAGSLRQRIETSAATPPVAPADVLFGLGARERADVVRVLWPAGILQAETEITPREMTVAELDRKPSSCPFLYTWNGRAFEFVTDFLGGGEMGYWVAPGERNVPDPDEYVRITSDQLRPREGRYELRITNELEEAVFLDRVQLLEVVHPEDVEVYPNEGLRSSNRRTPFVLYTTRGARPPVAATDGHGHDVRDRIAARDGRYVDDFRLSAIQGYADEHWLQVDVGPHPRDTRVLLLLTGWTDYAFSSDNVAAHQAGLAFRPPELEGLEPSGQWRQVMPEIGMPVGRPQTVVVDVTPFVAQGMRQFRIVSTLRVYWDEVRVDVSAPAAVRLTRLEPGGAALRWRGFSAESKPAGIGPTTYDYGQVVETAPWKLLPGRYTREGDVTPLLRAVDDQFVVSPPGDEVAIWFDASASDVPPGWTRTFLLYTDGFSKEMNVHSASPDRLDPLPFHGMSAYPYAAPERYPDTPAHRRYREEYNTRSIGTPVPPLETAVEAARAGRRPRKATR